MNDEQLKLIIEMPKRLHYLFKVGCAQHNTSMRQEVLKLIEGWVNTVGVYVPVEENVIDEEGIDCHLKVQDEKLEELHKELGVPHKYQKGPDETIN